MSKIVECRGEFGDGHTRGSGAWCRVCGKDLAWEETLQIFSQGIVLGLMIIAVTLVLCLPIFWVLSR